MEAESLVSVLSQADSVHNLASYSFDTNLIFSSICTSFFCFFFFASNLTFDLHVFGCPARTFLFVVSILAVAQRSGNYEAPHYEIVFIPLSHPSSNAPYYLLKHYQFSPLIHLYTWHFVFF